MPRLSKKKYQRGGWGETMIPEKTQVPTPSINKKSTQKPNQKTSKKPKTTKEKNKQRGGGWGSTTRTVYNLKGGWGGCSQTLPKMTGGGWGSPSGNIIVDVSPKQTGGFKRFLKKHF